MGNNYWILELFKGLYFELEVKIMTLIHFTNNEMSHIPPLLVTKWVKQISKNFMKFIHDSVNSKEKLIINRDSSSCNNPLRNFEMRNNLSFENRSGSVIKLNVSQN